jgi:hypothetical protein
MHGVMRYACTGTILTIYLFQLAPRINIPLLNKDLDALGKFPIAYTIWHMTIELYNVMPSELCRRALLYILHISDLDGVLTPL